MSKRLRTSLTLLAAMLSGLVVGLYAQSNSASRIANLSQEKADISKMDLILLNTRVSVMEQMLEDNFALPFVPHYIYNDGDSKIRIGVNVDSNWLTKTSTDQLRKVLLDRAITYCIAPSLAPGNLAYPLSQPVTEYCGVRFVSSTSGRSGQFEPKDVATYEDGKLILK